MWNTYYSCHILMKLEFSRQIFEESSNIKFHENPSSWSRVVPWGLTDTNDEAKSRFSQFCETRLKKRTYAAGIDNFHVTYTSITGINLRTVKPHRASSVQRLNKKSCDNNTRLLTRDMSRCGLCGLCHQISFYRYHFMTGYNLTWFTITS